MYMSPCRNQNGFHGAIAKINLAAFNSTRIYTPVEKLDLSSIDPDLKGFAACFTSKEF